MTTAPLQGRVALVTGAGRRTGRSIALALAAAGADVLVHCHHSQAEAEQVVQEITSMGRRAKVVQADLGDAAATQAAFSQAAAEFGRLDVLVNNACGIIWKRLNDLSVAEWHAGVEQTLHITYHACRAVLPLMREQGFGRIVNLIDVDADSHSSVPALTSYKIGKTGVLMLTRTLAVTEAPHAWWIRKAHTSPAPISRCLVVI